MLSLTRRAVVRGHAKAIVLTPSTKEILEALRELGTGKIVLVIFPGQIMIRTRG